MHAIKKTINLSKSYSVGEVSTLLDVTRQQVVHIINEGILDANRIGKRTYTIKGQYLKDMLFSGNHPLSKYADLLFDFVDYTNL